MSKKTIVSSRRNPSASSSAPKGGKPKTQPPPAPRGIWKDYLLKYRRSQKDPDFGYEYLEFATAECSSPAHAFMRAVNHNPVLHEPGWELCRMMQGEKTLLDLEIFRRGDALLKVAIETLQQIDSLPHTVPQASMRRARQLASSSLAFIKTQSDSAAKQDWDKNCADAQQVAEDVPTRSLGEEQLMVFMNGWARGAAGAAIPGELTQDHHFNLGYKAGRDCKRSSYALASKHYGVTLNPLREES